MHGGLTQTGGGSVVHGGLQVDSAGGDVASASFLGADTELVNDDIVVFTVGTLVGNLDFASEVATGVHSVVK